MSPEDNKRGEMMEDIVINKGLEIFNTGNSATFRRPLGPNGNIDKKIIDVTFGMNITDKVYNWQVAKTILSDHLPIEFNIGKGPHSRVSVWNYKKAD
jgi:hypothetical protein